MVLSRNTENVSWWLLGEFDEFRKKICKYNWEGIYTAHTFQDLQENSKIFQSFQMLAIQIKL